MYWDGWADKAIFMRKDGTFTKGNVYIDKGDEVCVVVLVKIKSYLFSRKKKKLLLKKYIYILLAWSHTGSILDQR